MKPKISVIIINYNTLELTRKCIESATKYIKNAEIILIDNGSTDGSKLYFSKIKNIVYVYNKDNLGFSKANNIGAKYATSDNLLFLNSDAEIKDDSFEKALAFYIKNKPGILSPRLLNTDNTIQASCFKNQSLSNAFKEYLLKQKYSFSKYYPTGNNPEIVENVVGAVMLISKTIFKKINGWSENYFMYYEDLDLCRKVKKNNYEIVYFPDWTIYHHHGASKSSNKNINLIKSSKIYHGRLKYYLITTILWLGQKI